MNAIYLAFIAFIEIFILNKNNFLTDSCNKVFVHNTPRFSVFKSHSRKFQIMIFLHGMYSFICTKIQDKKLIILGKKIHVKHI